MPAAGRPKDLGKREAIVEAAWRLFLQEGVHGVSLDAVARAARVSRVTLYGHFPDKSALFEATILKEMERLRAIQSIPEDGTSLRAVLIAFGSGLMRYLASPTVVSFYGTLAEELRRHPDLARSFYDLGPGQTHRNLTAILARAAARGEIGAPEPALAAEHLIGLWQGLSNYRFALSIDVEELVAGIDERVEQGVDRFLSAYPAAPSPSRAR